MSSPGGAGPSSPTEVPKTPEMHRSSLDSPEHSLDLPSLQPLSHNHPLLSAPTFSADSFLLSRLHIPLEELRGELRSYLSVLREELVQLINDDYEEFISLGTGLRGEEGRLASLQPPLKALGEKVETVKSVLVKHQDEVQAKLQQRTALREEKNLLDLLQRLFETLTRAEDLLDGHHDDDKSKMVQRVANEYTQLVYLLGKAKAEQCAVVDTVAPRVDGIRSRLSNELSILLVKSLVDSSSPKQVLKTYELIQGWDEAEEVVRGHFRTFCQQTITSSALVVPAAPLVPVTPITPHPVKPIDKLEETSPLSALYNRILVQVDTYSPLMSTAEDISERFDFLAGVLWPEIATSISDQLGSVIFAAGRPDDLHRHYTTTHQFITLLERLAPSPRVVTALRSSPAYEKLERRWQLPVYFQLRWKDIVTTFEIVLKEPSTPKDEWALSQSAAAWRAISTCWDPAVYIPEIANRFWRLSLQISVRYGDWLRSQVKDSDAEGDGAGDDQALKLAVAAVSDLAVWESKIATIELLTQNDLLTHLTVPTSPFSDKIVDILIKRCSESLKLVRSVASQLRAAPSKSTDVSPSYFVPSILKPLKQFYVSKPSLQSHKDWSTKIVNTVCSNYASILAGVRKTEDLLRRHRKSKKGGFSLFGSGQQQQDDSAGEEERFKKQMEADIEALKKDAVGLGVDVDNLPGWKELVEVVDRPTE